VQKNEEQEEQEQVLFLEGRKKELKKEQPWFNLMQPQAREGWSLSETLLW
jgi:hypothetical protein